MTAFLSFVLHNVLHSIAWFKILQSIIQDFPQHKIRGLEPCGCRIECEYNHTTCSAIRAKVPLEWWLQAMRDATGQIHSKQTHWFPIAPHSPRFSQASRGSWLCKACIPFPFFYLEGLKFILRMVILIVVTLRLCLSSLCRRPIQVYLVSNMNNALPLYDTRAWHVGCGGENGD